MGRIAELAAKKEASGAWDNDPQYQAQKKINAEIEAQRQGPRLNTAAPADMSKMQGPRIPPLVGYKAGTEIVQGMKDLNRSFTPQQYIDAVETARQTPANFADYQKRFENPTNNPLYEHFKNPQTAAQSNTDKIKEITGVDKPLYELMRNPQSVSATARTEPLTWQEKLQNAVQGRQAEFKPALAPNLQAVAEENSKSKGFFSNMGAALRSGGRSLEKGFVGTVGGSMDAGYQLTGQNPYSVQKNIKEDIAFLEKVKSEKPEAFGEVMNYLKNVSDSGKPDQVTPMKLRFKYGIDADRLLVMATSRNPYTYLSDDESLNAQEKGGVGVYLQQRQIPQKDEEYSVQKDVAPQWQQSAMTVAEQVPTQAVNIGLGLLGGGVGGGIAAGINAMGNGYIEAQERENNPLKSLGVGAAKGVLEGATSAIPIGELAGGMKALAAGGVKGGISSTLKSIGKQVLTQELEENVQEQLSLFGGKVVDQIAYGDGGWNTYGKEALQTAKDTTISTLFFTGVSLGGSAAYGKINPIAKAQIQKGVNAVEQKLKNGALTKQNFESDPDVQAVARLAKTGLENAAQSGKLNDIVTESGGENVVKYSNMNAEGEKQGGVVPYTQEQAEKISRDAKTYRNFVEGEDISISEFFERAQNTTDKFEKLYLGRISQELAEQVNHAIAEANLDTNVSNFDFVLSNDDMRHIDKKHGVDANEPMRGQVPITKDNIGMVKEIINNPDDIIFVGFSSEGKPAIAFKKDINGVATYVQNIADRRRRIDGQTLFQQQKKESVQAPNINNDPKHNIQNDLVPNSPVNPTIPQNGGEVNTNIRENLQNDTSQDVQRAANMDESTWVKPDNVNENAKYTPLHEIRDFIQDKFHVRIDTGKIQQKNALGIFKVKSENIRTLTANDVESISHELGHALDKKYNFRDMASINEAAALLSEDFKKNYKESEYGGEAAAEFLRIMLWDKTYAQKQSPNFYNEFMAKLDKADRQNIEKLADMVNGYFTGDIDTSSVIVSKLDKKNNDGLLSSVDQVYKDWEDDIHAIKKFEEYAQKSGNYVGTKAYRDAMNSKNVNAVVNNAITGKLADYDGNIVGDSLKDIMSAIKPNEFKAFSDYLINKHAPSWIEKGRTVYADPRANNVEFLNKKVQDFEQKYPHFKEASERLYQFNRQVGQAWLVDTGLISQDLWDKINEMYPFYIPLNRAVSNNTGGKAKSGFANQSSGIRRVNKGSGKEVINPIENIMMNTDRMIRAGTRNKVMQSIARIADSVDGMGWLMEQVAPDQVPRSVQVADYKEQLADVLAAESRRNGGAAKFEDAITDLIDSILPDTVTEFSPAQVQKNGIVSVMRDGKAQYYKVYDADLYNALTTMGSSATDTFGKIAKATALFTSLLTSKNPQFAFQSNIFRDPQTGYVNSVTTNNIAKFLWDYLTTLKSVVTNDRYYQQFKAMGGGESSMLSNTNDFKALKKELIKSGKPSFVSRFGVEDTSILGKVMNKSQNIVSSTVLHPMRTLIKAADIVETLPRLGEFKRTLNNGDDTHQAIYNAKEVTVNFARGGKKAKQLNKFVPFANAGLQGTDKLIRSLKAAPIKTLCKLAVGTILPEVICWLYNHRDEESKKEYNATSPYLKNNFFLIHKSGREFYKIPKAQETALLASLTGRILDQTIGGNKEAFDDFSGYAFGTLGIPMFPTDATGNMIDRATGLPSHETKLEDFGEGLNDLIIFGTFSNLSSNRDFKGTPIVPEYMTDDTKYSQKDQYDESTSYVSKWIGQHTGTSPKKLDYVINSNFGYLGAINKSFAPNKTVEDFMNIKGKSVANSAYSTNIFNNFYEEAAQAGRDANSNLEDKDAVLKSKQYDNFKSYVSKTNGLIKKEIFPERQETLKAQLRDEVQQFREGLPSLPDNAVRVYKETGESSVLPLANLDSVIKETKGEGANKTTTEHTLTTEQYKEYVRTYQQYVGEEYGKVNLANKDSDMQVKNLKSANEVAKEKAKQYMLDKHFK